MSLSEADLIPRVYNSEEDNQHFSIHTTMANIQSTNITWYTIGPRRLAKEYFMLTFQFEEAFKLESLIPIEQSLCSGEHIGGFHFTCELFGITIYSNQFSQLMQVKFNPIEQTFYIKSTVDILRIYFVHITPLVIKFCFGSHVLAHATVPIEQLIPSNDHILHNTVVLNRSFDMTLPPVAVTRHQEVILPHGFCAFEFAASPEELYFGLSSWFELYVSIFVKFPPSI
ncbi:unnamed protein product [Schistosoma margrebowiei]|uniref:Uncharacterized protein n=1 Tax=Schistosoma margrebowiei TaxID=48269 RepID=A0A183MZE9_9TREM|nr:unnamed protein product [Schistosoma margrebowiei]